MKKQFKLVAAFLSWGSIAVFGQTANPTVSNSRPLALGVANLTFYQKTYAVDKGRQRAGQAASSHW